MNEIKQIVRIAKKLIASYGTSVGKLQIDDKDCGPWNILKVRKFESQGVYAYQIKQQDIDKIQEAKSKQGHYKGKFEDYKKAGNWIATDLTKREEDGQFWLIYDNKFGKQGEKGVLYERQSDNSKKITKTFCGNDFTFQYHKPVADCYCFKLPKKQAYLMSGNRRGTDTVDVPQEMKLNGQSFHPGNYVFIDDTGKCDPWERSIGSMNVYYRVDNKNYNNEFNVEKDYMELILGKNNNNKEIDKQYDNNKNSKISRQLISIAKQIEKLSDEQMI